jgi:hypothetical protein
MSDPLKESFLEMEKVFYVRESGIGDRHVKTMHVFVVDKLTDEQKLELLAAETLLLELAEDARFTRERENRPNLFALDPDDLTIPESDRTDRLINSNTSEGKE